MKFTDSKLRELAPRSARYDLFHEGGQGLGLRVSPSGRKTWFSLYRFRGRARRFTLGTFQRGSEFPLRMSLASAQRAHREALELLDQGVDPATRRQVERDAEAKRASERRTLGDVLAEYGAIEVPTLKTGAELLRTLYRDIPESWLERPADAVCMRDVVLVIDSIREGKNRRRPAPCTADHFQGRIVRLFSFAAERGLIRVSPLAGLRRRGKRPAGRARVLNDLELDAMVRELQRPEGVDMSAAVADALLLLLATGQRPGDVAGMRWTEVEGPTWTIPAERYKTAVDHAVPLSSFALGILERRRLDAVAHSFVFPTPVGTFPNRTPTNRGPRDASSGGQRPMIVSALSRAMRRNAAALGLSCRATPHDLRRTVRTGLSSLRIDYITAELVIGHKLPTRMGQIYDRFDYLDAKRNALVRWGDRLQSPPAEHRAAA